MKKMKLVKPIMLAGTVALFLTGCKPVSLIQTPTVNIDTLPLKVADLSEDQLNEWSHYDLVADTIPGMSVNKAYEFLKGKKGTTVVVAVVDSGVDIEHEDLNGVTWENPNEIAGNGKDDDNNGYIDDINGWNFLGDITAENLEYVRILKNKTLAGAETVAKAQKDYDKEAGGAQKNKARYEQIVQVASEAHKEISKHLGKEDYTLDEVSAISDVKLAKSKGVIQQMFGYSQGEPIPGLIKQLNSGIDYYSSQLDNHLNMNGKFRAVLGDDPNDLKDTNYGNNNVIGPDKDEALHGTHVAGIIAAERDNGVGMNGIANNVKIMGVRAVPDGDEYDKDVALAIRYAVDNGAKVINTSFGKYYSPHADWVRDAIAYAGKKDVLIVNAAGNEGLDLDENTVYPNDQINNGEEVSDTFLTVGALNFTYGPEMIAGFSNYGKINVDVFAPGVKIYSTIPKNQYRHLQGTSMAAPNVAGVAALIRSYYPKLKAAQVKQILMNSGTPLTTSVVLGGADDNKKSFSEITTSGRMVNAYYALRMADQLAK
jgi:subtilisin family serine protease